MKNFRVLLIFLFTIFYTSNLYSKPVPPGAGEGDVAANILFLIDSSDSMKRPVGGVDSLEPVFGANYDSSGKIIISQGENKVGLVRFTAAGIRDDSEYEDIQYIGSAGCANTVDSSTVYKNTDIKKTFDPSVIQNLTASGTSISNENIIFFRAWTTAGKRAVFGYSENGQNCRIAIGLNDVKAISGGNADVRKIRTKTIDGTPYLFILGNYKRGGYLKVVNLNTMDSTISTDCKVCRYRNVSGFDVNNDGSIIYFTRAGSIVSSELEKLGNSYKDKQNVASRCNKVNNPDLSVPEMAFAFDLAIDPDNNNIGYISSSINNVIQKINLSNCSILASIGKGTKSATKNTGDPNSLEADKVVFFEPNRITVTSTRILVGTSKGYVDEFDKNKFTSALKDTAWLQNMGSPKIRRWDGVKSAVKAIVNDTTLTTGAYFGFGHWNSGEVALGKKAKPRGGEICHKNAICDGYYKAWSGNHPDGKSALCNENSCLNVGISPQGASKIMDVFGDLGTAWGTDSYAFSQLAHDYFTDPEAGGKVIDKEAVDELGNSCQLNYVIVVGDGEMMNTGGKTVTRLTALRKMGVKTLFVAYGGEISPGAINKFKKLARHGSCTGGLEGDKECEELIESDTPEDLKKDLMSKIRQILASKLAFTAPSITASVQEGGSLYQAQFDYQQYGEWHGHLLRKSIDGNGKVIHDMNTPGHWDAGEQIKGQSTEGSTPDTRKLWSALGIESDNYGNYDNFNSTENLSTIKALMESTGYPITDYHNSSSECSVSNRPKLPADVGNDGTTDDAKGLIDFIKGADYFDYDGDCNIKEVRDSVMGDVYHSQLIEVGPPEANLDFSATNEEAYFRATNNYQGFISSNASRQNIVYAGSNSGVLHAIDSITGDEVWGFIPPFVITNLPQLMNLSYDGNVDGAKGGSNPIFGVDGSPVVHDVFITAIKANGETESTKSWRTLLFVPYGRGGAGFSVLDVTKATEPVHMFSVFNDAINKNILVADAVGNIEPYPYNSGSASFSNSEEGLKAFENYSDARTTDEENGNTLMQDARAKCVKNDDNYHTSDSEMSCYIGKVFHFAGIEMNYQNGDSIPLSEIEASRITSEGPEPLSISSAKMVQNKLQVTFLEDMVINSYINEDAEDANDKKPTTPFSISTSCKGAGFSDEDLVYNYSELGETWSTPRIARIPSYDSPENFSQDKYVAILGGGMSQSDKCVGSAMFVVSLEEFEDAEGRVTPAGGIYGAHLNGGPISIVDTTDTGIVTVAGSQVETLNGSNITNSIPASPVVITPDTAIGIPWRGAMVYINDLEGKVTKINLTSQNNVKLFDQTTLFRLDSSSENARYSYFGMDAGLGVSNGKFHLFGSTGNFTDLGGTEEKMDNILYGLIDPNYPLFKHLNGEIIPLGADDTFAEKAHMAANKARSIDNLSDSQVEDGRCIDVTGNLEGCIKLSQNENAWVIGLDRAGGGLDIEGSEFKTFRKASAPPTLFKGNVYFPIYQPPTGNQRCNQGASFICVADDECGTNGSSKLALNDPPDDVDRAVGNICGYVSKGVLSELVIFGDKLFANVAGPDEDAETLISILSAPGAVISNKGGWRDSSF